MELKPGFWNPEKVSLSPKRDVPSIEVERFLHDLEMKMRKQNRHNKRKEMEPSDWFLKRIQTRVAFGWLSDRSDEKTSFPKHMLEINQYFALMPYCNTIGQLNNTFSILGFSLVGKRGVYVLIFLPIFGL